MNTQKINAYVAEKLEAEICPTHGKHPTIVWEGDNINANCCCDEFRSYIVLKAGDLLKEAALKEIEFLFTR
jgi:hypothetical protein